MTSGPITSWQLDGEKVETVTWVPKSLWMVTAAMKLNDACFLDENLESLLKGRDITFLTKVHLVQAVFFPVAMYECKIWTIKKAEHQRIDAFGL